MHNQLVAAVQAGLEAAKSYAGAKSFPYQVPSGVAYWRSLMRSVQSLWKTSVRIAATKAPTWHEIDELFPKICGKYSLSKKSRNWYMRRHLTRFIHVLLLPLATVQQMDLKDWRLVWAMGRGPRDALTALGLDKDKYEDALNLKNHLQTKIKAAYSTHDFICFICLACKFIQTRLKLFRTRLRAQRKKNKKTGIFKQPDGRYYAQLSQWREALRGHMSCLIYF